MANDEQVQLIRNGVPGWNQWREAHPGVCPDLREVDLSGAKLRDAHFGRADLSGASLRYCDLNFANFMGARLNGAELNNSGAGKANFTLAELRECSLAETGLMEATFTEATLDQANLRGANLRHATMNSARLPGAKLGNAILSHAFLYGADLSGAELRNADLSFANLHRANLSAADLRQANLSRALLSNANLSHADLGEANLREATLVETDLTGATLERCSIYGISAWNVQVAGAMQNNLIITRFGEPVISVDNLKVAQFIYLLLNNAEIRAVIDTLTSKTVLILGRFTEERKQVLLRIQEELRRRNYLPILFDFEGPASRDITETVRILASMARFVIADLSEPRSIPQELMAIVPSMPSVPVQPILLRSEREYGMYEHFTRYPWVLPIQTYHRVEDLLASLADEVIAPAEAMATKLQKRSGP